MKASLVALGLAALLLGSNLAYGQQHQLKIDDAGKVLAQHQHHHAKAGNKITWVRDSGASKPWFLKFTNSPCAEGNEFASDGAKTCTINVACKAAGDAACKSYTYQSATGRAAAMNDPDIIVDP
jgi:hypothetical protein